MKLPEKFVAYIDVLGFKHHVEAAERGEGMSFEEILDVVAQLGKAEDRKTFETYGPMMCPQSRCIKRDLDFRIIQVSDCAILSAEISPAGVINLIERVWRAVVMLLQKGLMCRGYITRGLIYHTDNQVIGSGYHKAYMMESAVSAFARDAADRGTPFVEIDPVVTSYVVNETDECVRKMFARLVKRDGEVAAIFPFQLLSHSFPITADFDPEKQRASNANLRKGLQAMRTKVLAYVANAKPEVRRKAEHYVGALDAQLRVCDETDAIIAAVGRPFPGR